MRSALGKKRTVYPVIMFLIAVFCVSQVFMNTSDVFERLASYMVYPVIVMQQKIVTPVKFFFERKHTLHELREKLDAMQKSYETLLAETIALRATLQYAYDIQEVLEFKKAYDNMQGRVVQIIAKNISDQAHYILIDAGTNKGVTKDMVALYKNCLLGRVEEVYPLYSKVILITDRTCKVAASCATTHACGIHEGCNEEHRCVLNRVSHLASLQEQDIVLSSGEGMIFPRGFALGRVKSYASQGLMYHIDVEPLFDIKTINYCFLIKRN